MYGRELTLSIGNECPTGYIPMVHPITTGTLYTLQAVRVSDRIVEVVGEYH